MLKFIFVIKKYGKTTNNKNITIPIKYENYRGIMFYHFCTVFAGALALKKTNKEKNNIFHPI